MSLNNQSKRAEKLKFWELHIRRWQESDLSISTYCKRNNLGKSTFFYWREQLLMSFDKPCDFEGQFIEVTSEQTSKLSLTSYIESERELTLSTNTGFSLKIPTKNLGKDLPTILNLLRRR